MQNMLKIKNDNAFLIVISIIHSTLIPHFTSVNKKEIFEKFITLSPVLLIKYNNISLLLLTTRLSSSQRKKKKKKQKKGTSTNGQR